jgi:hypothetical protein
VLSLETVRALQCWRARDETGSFFVEGARFVLAASDAGHAIRGLVVAPPLLKSPIGQMLARSLRAGGVPSITISADDYRGRSRDRRSPAGSARS